MLFSKYSHKIIEIKERPPKIENEWKTQSSVIFEFDNGGKKRRDCRNVKIMIRILL